MSAKTTFRSARTEVLVVMPTAFAVGAVLVSALHALLRYSDSFAAAIGPLSGTPEAVENLRQLRDAGMLWSNYGVAVVWLATYASVIAVVEVILSRQSTIPMRLSRRRLVAVSALAGGVAGVTQFLATAGFCKAGCIGDRVYGGLSAWLGLDQIFVGLAILSLPLAVTVVAAAIMRTRSP